MPHAAVTFGRRRGGRKDAGDQDNEDSPFDQHGRHDNDP